MFPLFYFLLGALCIQPVYSCVLFGVFINRISYKKNDASSCMLQHGVIWHENFFTFCLDDVAYVFCVHFIFKLGITITWLTNLHSFIKCMTVVHWQATAYTFFIHLTVMQAFLDLGELLITSDTGAALDAFKTVRACHVSPFSGWLTLFS